MGRFIIGDCYFWKMCIGKGFFEKKFKEARSIQNVERWKKSGVSFHLDGENFQITKKNQGSKSKSKRWVIQRV